MSNNKNNFAPKGRKGLPVEILRFGRHLVYSEGTKTEPFYVNNIKKCIGTKYSVDPNVIDIVQANNKSTNTIYLVKFAIKDVKKRLKKNERIDHVWIFFDKDSFPLNDYNAAIAKLENMNNSNDQNIEGFKYEKNTEIVWHSCHSNEAFELWLCLYFNYLNSSLDRNQLISHLNDIPNLKKIDFKYEKDLENIHDILINNGGSLDKAIKYAEKLKTNNNGNPSTAVYKFVKYFKPYMK